MIELCGHRVGLGQPLFLIAGPDVIESEEMVLKLCAALEARKDPDFIITSLCRPHGIVFMRGERRCRFC